MSLDAARSEVKRNGNRVALVSTYPKPDPALPERISNHGMRMVEASARSAYGENIDVHVFDLHDATADELADALIEVDPDVIGFSSYLWSLPLFADAIPQLVEDDPSRLIVLGGPSAQPAMLDQVPFHPIREMVDVLVMGEGELAFVEILESSRDQDALGALAGVAQWIDGNWHVTKSRPLGDLNELASPYVQGIVPSGGLSVMQTYRGCPFSCSFCEWGVMESPKRVRTKHHLVEELHAMEKIRTTGVLMVDAGLNLNAKAFTELESAAQETGYLKNRKLISEIYPSKINDRHLRFLEEVGEPMVGVGLQSFDANALTEVERSFDEVKFDQNVAALNELGNVAIEIILGLPGDSPATFRETFWRARSYPCTLRVYHCVVLPSALMVRSPPEHELNYDPKWLKMISCLGWSADELTEECEFLNEYARSNLDLIGEFLWVFSPPQSKHKRTTGGFYG
jgi:radical SAM superfamily enzyme YgiQ (UPF0313 family)